MPLKAAFLFIAPTATPPNTAPSSIPPPFNSPSSA